MTYSAKLSRRLAAWLLTLVMLVTGFVTPAYAQALADWELLSIRLSWLDANGAAYEAYALPVSWSQDQSYWVQVSADAPLQALTMNISHPDHAYVFDPADGSTLLNVVDAGTAMDVLNTIIINAYEGETLVNTYNLYVSTQIDMPVQPAPEPAQANVTIIYQSDDGSLYHEESRTMTEGEDNTVAAKEFEGYTLTSAGSVWVEVSANGASPNPVVFTYARNPAQADVTVIHQSDDGAIYEQNAYTLSSAQTAEERTFYAKEYAGYVLNGAAAVTVDVTDAGANPAQVIFYYNKIQPKQADVLVRYLDQDGNPLAGEHYVPCFEGQENAIAAQQFEGYTLQGEGVVYVIVNSDGSASHSVVEFRYAKNAVTADVTVIHQSDDGAIYEQSTHTLSSAQPAEERTFYAKEYAGYVLNGAAAVTVDVTDAGANPAQVVFYYNKIQPKQADVLVRYLDQDGNPLAGEHYVPCFEGQENAIAAQQFEGYTLQGEGVVYVVVNSDGSASHSVVEFRYVKDEQPTPEPTAAEPTADPTAAPTAEPTAEPIPEATPTMEPVPTEAPIAMVEVYYQNMDGHEVATAQQVSFPDGQDYPVYALPYDLIPGYVLVSAGEVLVDVAGGVADPAVVVFYYDVEAQPTELPAEPTPTAEPVPTEAPAEPTATAEPVPTETPIPEATATPEPLPTETPVPTEEPAVETPIPQGSMINRFGIIAKKQTAVRTGPSTDYDLLKRLAKGTAVYMLRIETNASGEAWARVLLDGEVFFIRADCIEAMTQADSDLYMAAEMATPVPPFTAEQLDNPGAQEPEPTATAEPTAVPTAEPTAVPTAEPTAVPTAEPTPAPTDVPAAYTGYALTAASVAIRSQVAGGDETIIRLADVNELVMVTGQNYVNGSAWSSVTTLDGMSGFVQDSMLRHINNEEAQYYINLWNDAHATAAPTAEPTASPTPTAEPAQYSGYALTQQAVALRTEVSSEDKTIISRLEANTLVMVTGQTFHEGSSWSLSTTLDNVSGYLPDSSLRRINNEEAKYYLDLWNQANPTATPTAAPVTPEPAKITGYAYTVGDDVYFRTQASTMASIIDVLPQGVIVYVRDQDYPGGEAWHVVQYNSQWGYIRADMLRMMTIEEENAYLGTLATPEPTAAATPQPYNPGSLSSYGYVSESTVNFRKEPSTSASRIRQLKQYAFCLVLGTTEVDGVTWYRVNFGGAEGYIHGKYFKQMSMAELEEFLDSEEYRKGVAANSNTGNTDQDYTGGGIVSAEDQTVDQWTNPNNGLQVSYAPFDPFATPEPLATAVPTATVTIPAVPTATLEPIPTMEVIYPTGDGEQGGSGVVGWVIAVILIALIGGGVYAYVTYTNNKRKAAQRAAARRAQAAAQQRSQAARPYARSTAPQANQPRTGTYPNQAAQRAGNGQPQVRRPYTAQEYSQAAYTRPAESAKPQQQADYTASYRNPNAGENAARPMGRRSAYRAQQAQQNGYTASYRNEQENGDFQQDKNNGDFQ